tara:strand:- start:1126 stop:1662 length:537 start_codon:yes stop_codon:yes gene_type:complete
MDTGMIWIIIVGASAAGFYWIYRKQQARAAADHLSALRRAEVERLAFKAQDACAKLSEMKTATGQSNQAKRAIAILEEAAAYPECHQVIRNYDEMCRRLDAIQKVAPVIDKVEKAYRHKFKGNEKSELNALLDAMYEITTENVTDQDIIDAEIYPSGTGEIVSVTGLRERCRQLGWKG